MSKARLVNAPVILPTLDVLKTAEWYRDVLGFRLAEHLDADEPFAAAYRDDVELVFVQIASGTVGGAAEGEGRPPESGVVRSSVEPFVPNRIRFGAGYDVYLDPDTVEGVDEIYAELVARGARVVRPPAMVAYGSYEFIVEDPDGRWVCVGRVADRGFYRGVFG